MTDAIIVGLDPGASGGIAWTKPGVGIIAGKMPEDFDALAKLAADIRFQATLGGRTPVNYLDPIPVVVYCEQVTGYVAPSKGESVECALCHGTGESMSAEGYCPECGGTGRVERGNRQPGHAMFTFGKNTGAAIMAFKMIGATVHEIPPKTWQAPLFVKKHGSSKGEWKNILKGLAQRFFPGVKVTLATADALLLLRFGMQKEGANLPIVQGTPQRPQNGAPARKARPSAPAASATAGTFGNCAECKAPHEEDAGIPWQVGTLTHFLCRACSSRMVTGRNIGRLCVGDWKGVQWLFRGTTIGNGWVIERRATTDDLFRIPRKP